MEIGIKVQKGDEFVLPARFITIAANPLKSTGQLYSGGLDWFAQRVFEIQIANPNSRDNFLESLEEIQENNENYFIKSELAAGIDLNDEAGQLEFMRRLEGQEQSVEWLGFNAAVMCSIAADAIRDNNAAVAAWAMTVAERFRSLAVFKTHFHEVVMMGNSAARLLSLMREWDANVENGDEGFWQIRLREHSYAFSQLFSAPVTFIQGGAYVGGTKLDGKDGRYLDFLLSGGNANQAILVEIKTPTTKLLGGKYRQNVYPPSQKLSGALVQVNDYCDQLREEVHRLTKDKGIELNTFNPRRIILIGNYKKELDDARKRHSFELFRSSLAGVEIVTFDEFFRKVDQLATLFNLTRSKPVA
jgi:hypothetical protein